MERLALALLMLALAILACSLEPTAGTVSEPFPTQPDLIPSPTPPITSTPPAGELPDICSVTASALHLRRGPGVAYAVIAYLALGDRLTIQTRNGAWWQVETDQGAGYVHSRYCEVQP